MGILSTFKNLGDTFKTVTQNPLTQLGVGLYQNNKNKKAINSAVGQQQAGYNQAGNIQQKYADASLLALNNAYQEGKGFVQPYQDAGVSGLAGYQNLMTNPSSITDNPGYQFQFDQGKQAVNRSASANKMLQSGNTLTALTEYGQNYANNALQTERSAYLPLIEGGIQSGRTLAGLGENFSRGVVGVNEGLGNALSGYAVDSAGYGAAGDLMGQQMQNSLLGDLFNLGQKGQQAANGANQAANALQTLQQTLSAPNVSGQEAIKALIDATGMGSGEAAAIVSSSLAADGTIASPALIDAATKWQSANGLPSMSSVNPMSPVNPTNAFSPGTSPVATTNPVTVDPLNGWQNAAGPNQISAPSMNSLTGGQPLATLTSGADAATALVSELGLGGITGASLGFGPGSAAAAGTIPGTLGLTGAGSAQPILSSSAGIGMPGGVTSTGASGAGSGAFSSLANAGAAAAGIAIAAYALKGIWDGATKEDPSLQDTQGRLAVDFDLSKGTVDIPGGDWSTNNLYSGGDKESIQQAASQAIVPARTAMDELGFFPGGSGSQLRMTIDGGAVQISSEANRIDPSTGQHPFIAQIGTPGMGSPSEATMQKALERMNYESLYQGAKYAGGTWSEAIKAYEMQLTGQDQRYYGHMGGVNYDKDYNAKAEKSAAGKRDFNDLHNFLKEFKANPDKAFSAQVARIDQSGTGNDAPDMWLDYYRRQAAGAQGKYEEYFPNGWYTGPADWLK